MEATFLDASPDNRLSTLRPTTAPGRTDMLYDGRGYLRQAHLTFSGSPEDVKITSDYSSEGLLMSRTEERYWSGGTTGPDDEDSLWLVSNNETTHLFYFAGRPVAQLTDGSLFYITTDHLGTPVLITNNAGVSVWAGGLEPFGRPWTAGGNPDPEPLSASSQKDKGLSRLSSESAFLRYPGQWASDAFRVGGVRMEVYYNVHRWYDRSTGNYLSPDPVPPPYFSHTFSFAQHNPIAYIDPDGRAVQLPSTSWLPMQPSCLVGTGIGTAWNWIILGGGPRFAHCYASCVLVNAEEQIIHAIWSQQGVFRLDRLQ